jgi:single-stranded-DNA-specific exonuclease
VNELTKLKPLGQGNPAVHLMARGLTQWCPPQRIGKDQQHLKMRVTDGAVIHEAIWWNFGQQPLPDGRFDLAFVPEINEYNGRQRVQLKVLDGRAGT